MPPRRREGQYNPKRKVSSETAVDDSLHAPRYGGNPEHKTRPGDYGLEPPVAPRPDKTLCDAAGPFPKQRAEDLLADGIRRGMVSVQRRGEWPQNVWSVGDDGIPYEAELENKAVGAYHGYPMAADDPFRNVVIKEWNRRGSRV